MILTAALAALLLAAPFCAWRVGYGWPSEIRDRMLLGVATLSAAVMTIAVEPGLGILFGLAVYHWRSRHQLAGVLVLGTAGLIYTAVKFGPPAVEVILPPVIVAGASIQALWGVLQYLRAWRLGWASDRRREAVHGSMGNRVFLSALCAIALPLAPLPVMPLLGLGLLVSLSWTGLLAACVGLVITTPLLSASTWPLALAFVGAVPWMMHWRGRPSDSWRARLLIWRLAANDLLARSWSRRLTGFGHGSLRQRSRWWCSRNLTPQHFRDAHNDLIQATYEWGLLGLAAVLLWAASVARGMAWQDPLTGALAAGVVTAMAQFPSYLPQVSLALLVIAALLARRTVAG